MAIDFRKIENIEADKLRRSDLDHISCGFRDVHPGLLGAKKLFLSLKDKDLNNLPGNYQSYLSSQYDYFIDLCIKVKNFRVKEGEALDSAKARHKDLSEEIGRFTQDTFPTRVIPLIALVVQSDQSGPIKIEDAINQIDSRVDVVNQAVTTTKEKVDEANALIRSAKELAVEKLTHKYGTIFAKQALKNLTISIVSLFLFFIFVGVFIVATIDLFSPLITQLASPEFRDQGIGYIVINAIFRLTLLSILFVMVRESLSNFNINMHLYNLNKHRQNSLESFDALIKLGQSPEVQDKLVREIAKTIYATNKIGYLKNDRKGLNIPDILSAASKLKD